MRAASFILCLWSGLLFVLAPHPCHAESEPLDQLNQRVLDLFRKHAYADAVHLAEQAVAAARSQRGEKDPATIKALVQQAQTLLGLTRRKEAEAVAKRAVEIAEETQPGESALLADAFEAQGIAMMPEVEADPAEIGVLQRALSIREKHIKSNPFAYLKLLQDMTPSIVIPRQPEERARMLVHAVEIAENELGPGHPVIAGLLDRLAALYAISAFEGDTRPTFETPSDTQQRITKIVQNTGKAQSLRSVPELPEHLRGFPGARYSEAGRKILGHLLRSGELGRLEPQAILALSSPLAGLGKDLERSKRAAEAERVYILLRDVQIQAVNMGQAARQSVGWKTAVESLLDLYREQNRLDAYEKLAAQVTAEIDEQLTVDPRGASLTIVDKLAADYEQLGDPAKAERFWQKQMATYEARGDLTMMATTLVGIGSVYLQFERWTSRDEDFLQGIAGFYGRQGRWDEAEATFRRGIDILLQLCGADASKVAAIKRQLSLFLERRSNAVAKQAQ
jgi:tetratricopeptide (TPR) repeat protein